LDLHDAAHGGGGQKFGRVTEGGYREVFQLYVMARG
jgi:hypothetical protein